MALVSVLYNIQFHLRILQNAERAEIEMNRNNNILWLEVFSHDAQTGSNYAPQSVKRASIECPITMSAQKPQPKQKQKQKPNTNPKLNRNRMRGTIAETETVRQIVNAFWLRDL